MKNIITIVGAGQVGSMLAYRLLRNGKKIRIIDSGNKLNRQNQQIPWGWLRKFSLQSEVKKNIMTNEFPIIDSYIKKKINFTEGPMLISTTNNQTVYAWSKWILNNNETDAKIFTPNEAEKQFNISSDYFKNKGGVFMCDSRDSLLDFSLFNNYLWEFMKDHENCEIIDNCKINGIVTNKNIATHLITNENKIPINKTFFCIGNQTAKILDESLPIMELTLPYVFCDEIPQQNYIGLWNKYSSLTLFNDGNTKMACGVQSMIDLKNIKLNTSLHFLNMGIKGYSNINLKSNEKKLFNKAIEELKVLGFNYDYNIKNTKTCNIDVTPNLSPYIYFPSKANNILSISGLSGSGSMVLDNNFMDLLIKSMDNNKIDTKLKSFNPSNSIYNNWFPPKEKQTPLSSIV